MRKSRVIRLNTKDDSGVQIVSQSVVLKGASPGRIGHGQESQETLRELKEVRNLVEGVERKLSVISKKHIIFAKQSVCDYVDSGRELQPVPNSAARNVKRTNSMDMPKEGMSYGRQSPPGSMSPLKRGQTNLLNDIRHNRLTKPLR